MLNKLVTEYELSSAVDSKYM